jgi:hypothetical protein
MYVIRLPLGSHQLRVETDLGAQTPFELRSFPCKTGIQSEHHVLLMCPRSEHL